MIFSGKTKAKNHQRLAEALYEMTQSDECEIKFSDIAFDVEKPIMKLKGLNNTPDFTITFGNNLNRAHIIPDSDPSYDMHFETTLTNLRKLTYDILMACSVIMLRLSVKAYKAFYNGNYGSLRFSPENKILFLSDKPIEIEIETIVDTYLMDSFRVPEFTNAILIETNSDNSYYIALEKPDEFGMELATRRMKLDNIEPLSAS